MPQEADKTHDRYLRWVMCTKTRTADYVKFLGTRNNVVLGTHLSNNAINYSNMKKGNFHLAKLHPTRQVAEAMAADNTLIFGKDLRILWCGLKQAVSLEYMWMMVEC